MLDKLFVMLQFILPQHLLSRFAGVLAETKIAWFKNFLIRQFMRAYPINMSLALQPDPLAYPDFNAFFTRKLNPKKRPIVSSHQSIACPVDGTIAAIGTIEQNQLLQAKQAYFNLEHLLGGQSALAKLFQDGNFATFYLAPHNYHRIHMPLTGQLIQTIYVPGKLFSVNPTTTALIPDLYSRNERLICLFETEIGKMAVILVGAMIVGSIQTVWMLEPIRSKNIRIESVADAQTLTKGAELGLFKMGSTVILLFQNHCMKWISSCLQKECPVEYGQLIGHANKPGSVVS